MKYLRGIFAAFLVLISPLFVDALKCKVKAGAECNVSDPRKELKKYHGMDCIEFAERYSIDRQKAADGSYSGVINENGYPQIRVRYKWSMCNMNEKAKEKVTLIPEKSSASLMGKQEPINKEGVLKPGLCRNHKIVTRIDTEVRKHIISTEMTALLTIGGKVYKSDSLPVTCEDSKMYKTILKYKDIEPISMPSMEHTTIPSVGPSLRSQSPTLKTATPSFGPTISPSSTVSAEPTASIESATPSMSPSASPSTLPKTPPSSYPTILPTKVPTISPTKLPSKSPLKPPGVSPPPIRSSSKTPSVSPTNHLSFSPTGSPSLLPSYSPSTQPSQSRSKLPSASPSIHPSSTPTMLPTKMASDAPSTQPIEASNDFGGGTGDPTSGYEVKILAVIDEWLKSQSLNEFGDALDTIYAGVDPLFDESTEETQDRYDYLLDKFPDEPWNEADGSTSGGKLVDIDKWLATANLNRYGDPLYTMYAGGSPLFDESTGETQERYEYLMNKFPDQPWNEVPIDGDGPRDGKAQAWQMDKVDAWLTFQSYNEYGDPEGTMYAGVDPLFDERTGETQDRYEYLKEKFPDEPWNDASADGGNEVDGIFEVTVTATEEGGVPTILSSVSPTKSPSTSPSNSPIASPSASPSQPLSASPSSLSTTHPSSTPSILSTILSTISPTKSPSRSPSRTPSASPSASPSQSPSLLPSALPTAHPSSIPSTSPSRTPSASPSASPSQSPSLLPSALPTAHPSSIPSTSPSRTPSASPSASPSESPSQLPSALPTAHPSSIPSTSPSRTPSASPSASPSESPSQLPSALPTIHPSSTPSMLPTKAPSLSPSRIPSELPTKSPSQSPTKLPSALPTTHPSSTPSMLPTNIPTISPTKVPSKAPSDSPTKLPSLSPTVSASVSPSSLPSATPSIEVSDQPSSPPTSTPDPECVDDHEWTSGGSHIIFSGLSCSNIGGVNLWCQALAGEKYRNMSKTVDEACCKCRGVVSPTVSNQSSVASSSMQVHPSSTPTLAPTSSPTVCEDDHNWVTGGSHPILSGLSCDTINKNSVWCEVLADEKYRNDSKMVHEACCSCKYSTSENGITVESFDILGPGLS